MPKNRKAIRGIRSFDGADTFNKLTVDYGKHSQRNSTEGEEHASEYITKNDCQVLLADYKFLVSELWAQNDKLKTTLFNIGLDLEDIGLDELDVGDMKEFLEDLHETRKFINKDFELKIEEIAAKFVALLYKLETAHTTDTKNIIEKLWKVARDIEIFFEFVDETDIISDFDYLLSRLQIKKFESAREKFELELSNICTKIAKLAKCKDNEAFTNNSSKKNPEFMFGDILNLELPPQINEDMIIELRKNFYIVKNTE